MKLTAYFQKARFLLETPGNRGRRLRWLLRSAAWFLHKRISRRPWHITLFGGMRFACHPASLMAEHVIYRSEYFDFDEMRFIENLLRPGDVFLDVGANVGLYTLLAVSRIGPEGEIFSVEPHPANLVYLRENLEANKLTNVHVLPIAAGEREGEVSLSDADVFAGVDPAGVTSSAAIKVPLRRLDDVLSGKSPVVTKVDVEGYEWGVFHGLSHTMRADRLPIALFELIGHMERYGQSEDEFCRWWTEQGYRLSTYHHDSHTFTLTSRPRGDVFALSPRGIALVKERLPHVKFVEGE